MKLAVITSTRAEYGLLFPLINRLLTDKFFDTHVIVTGTHLLDKFGYTIQYIRADQVPIAYQVPIMDEEPTDVCSIIANAIERFGIIYQKEKYDAIVVLGDRYELYGFCIPAILNNIPIIHLHGGEKTEGAVDEKIRHSITKMSAVHFASIDEYANRIIQMGENPKYVFKSGALGIDNIMSFQPMSVSELEKELKVELENRRFAIVTFHPTTLSTIQEIKKQVIEVFDALVESGLYCIVTMPNSDKGGDIVDGVIRNYINQYREQFYFVKSLGQKRYLSLLKNCSVVIGNSSSGIIEAPSFNIPTVDIGERQKGRFAPETVIHCQCTKDEILRALSTALSREFKERIKNYVNPYGDGNAAQRIVDTLKKIDFSSEDIVQKKFYDLVMK